MEVHMQYNLRNIKIVDTPPKKIPDTPSKNTANNPPKKIQSDIPSSSQIKYVPSSIGSKEYAKKKTLKSRNIKETDKPRTSFNIEN